MPPKTDGRRNPRPHEPARLPRAPHPADPARPAGGAHDRERPLPAAQRGAGPALGPVRRGRALRARERGLPRHRAVLAAHRLAAGLVLGPAGGDPGGAGRDLPLPRRRPPALRALPRHHPAAVLAAPVGTAGGADPLLRADRPGPVAALPFRPRHPRSPRPRRARHPRLRGAAAAAARRRAGSGLPGGGLRPRGLSRPVPRDRSRLPRPRRGRCRRPARLPRQDPARRRRAALRQRGRGDGDPRPRGRRDPAPGDDGLRRAGPALRPAPGGGGVPRLGLHTALFAPPGRRVVALSPGRTINPTFRLVDVLCGNAVSYLHQPGTAEAAPGAFGSQHHLADPRAAAEDLLRRMERMAAAPVRGGLAGAGSRLAGTRSRLAGAWSRLTGRGVP